MARHSEASLQKKVKWLWEKLNFLQSLDRDDEKKRLVRGKTFKVIEERKLYLYFGNHIKTFEDLLKETKQDEKDPKLERPIMGCGRTQVYNYIWLYKMFGDIPEAITGLPDYRLFKLKPYITEENKKELTMEARGVSDNFNELMRELKGKPTQDKCNCEDFKDRWVYKVECPNCHRHWRIKKPKE
jgi:hypothetical protein